LLVAVQWFVWGFSFLSSSSSSSFFFFLDLGWRWDLCGATKDRATDMGFLGLTETLEWKQVMDQILNQEVETLGFGGVDQYG
jgi:hypothetical protein